MVTVCAHRGVSAEFPENTIAAFKRALELHVDGIELDVHLSRDGVPVVMHDETVDATTDGTGLISGKSVAELKTLDAGNGERVPTLHEVLELVGDRLHVNIELKAATAGRAVLSVTETMPALRFAVSSFNHDVLREIRAVRADVDLWPLAPFLSDDLLKTARELGARQLNLWDPMVNRDVIDTCAAHGVGVWVWTVNAPERAGELVSIGAIGICTDNPQAVTPTVRGVAPTPGRP